jgi:iron complex outermembrane recepter protein
MKAAKIAAIASVTLKTGVALAAVIAPGIVRAQEAQAAQSSEETTTGLKDIIVTAERRSENLQTTPVSVTALDSKALEQARVLDTQILSQQTPSLQIRPSGGGSPVSLMTALRGQYTNGINITNDPAVALYIDDIYIGKDAGNVTDIVDVGQIEVLKGPQGTLFGRNSTGGAIRYASNRPDPSGFSGSAKGAYGNYDAYLVQGVLNAPLSDTTAVRFAGSYRGHDGYTTTNYVSLNLATGAITPVRSAKTDNLQSELYRFSFLSEPTSDLTIHATATYHDRQIDGYLARGIIGDRNITFNPAVPPAIALSPSAQNSFYAGETEATDLWGNPRDSVVYTRGYLLTGDIAYRLGDSTTVKFITGYLRNKIRNRDFDVDGTVLPASGSSTFQDFKQYSAELQLAGTLLADRLDYVGGLYYFDEKGRDETDSYALAATGPSHNLNLGNGFNKSYSAFAHGKYKIGDATTVQAGLRYTEDKKRLVVSSRQGVVANRTVLPPCVYIPGSKDVDIATCTFSPKTSFNYWSYLFGVDHKFSDDVFAYAKTSRTTKSGGHQIRATTGDVTPFRPETITDYEIGLKLDFNRAVRLNLAAYYGKYEDIQNTKIVGSPNGTTDNPSVCVPNDTCTGPATTVVRNEGDADVSGVEGELQTRFGPFGFNAALSYVNFDFKAPGFQQIFTPHWQYSVAGTYERDIGSGRFNARLGLAGQSKVYKERSIATQAANPVRLAPLKAVDILSARAGFTFDSGFEVAVFGDNLTKVKYYLDALNVASRFTTGYGFAPRTYGIEVGYKF